MIPDQLVQAAQAFGQSILHQLPLTAAMAVAFPLLTLVSSRCNDGAHWWRNPHVVTDLCYWFILPLVGSFVRIGFLTVGGAMLYWHPGRSGVRRLL